MTAPANKPQPFTRAVLRQIVDLAPEVPAVEIARRLAWSGAQLKRVCRAHGVALIGAEALDPTPDGDDAPAGKKRVYRRRDDSAMIGIHVPVHLEATLRQRAAARGVTLSKFLREHLLQAFGVRE